MNNAQIYIYFQLFTIVTTLLYPCYYIDLNERIFKCDICKCISSPSPTTTIYSTSNFCQLTLPLTCTNNSNEEFLRLKLNEITHISDQSKKQIEFHNFNTEILNHEQICLIKNFSQITFFNFIYNNINNIPKCLSTISSLRFVNSFINNNSFVSEILTFYNTTFNIMNFNLNSTKILNLYSIKFLIKPFELKSLSTLTHLTIISTDDFYLIGSFPHLSYLNLDNTNLNDKQLNKLFLQTTIPDLITMILSNNQITTITNKFPSTIRYLDLSNNQIKSLDYYSFKSLYSLNILNLSLNSPIEIQQDTFTRIPYLEILDLSYTLPTLSFDDLFLPLQKLHHLNISSNYLDTLPHLPIPHDAHTIESYDHHLPVLYVDLSNNNFEKIDLEIFSSPSTQDKYIISLNMNYNRLKTLKYSSLLLNDTKRRGPFIELDIDNNPLECDCNLYETISNLLQTNTSHQNQNNAQSNLSFQQTPPNGFHSTNLLYHLRTRRQYYHSSSNHFHNKQTRIKILRLSHLTCIDMIEPKIHRTLYDLNSSNSLCSYKKYCSSTCSCCSSSFFANDCICYSQCPIECSCIRSYDLTTNYINCSNHQLYQIPLDIPQSTTHLYLNNNRLKSIESNLTYLNHMKHLSLANNSLEYLTNDEFSTMIHMEILDLSSNSIENIESKTFSNLKNLKELYLHNNRWIPNFYNKNNEFQMNINLNFLTYANGLSCNRTRFPSTFNYERPLTVEDCCINSHTESCQQTFRIDKYNLKHDDNATYSKTFFSLFFHQKYILIGFILILFLLICIITFYINRRKRQFLTKEKFLSNNEIKQQANHYHTKALKTLTEYSHHENDNSISYTDEDEYASIPLTTSQTDLSSVLHSQTIVPPLPPRRLFVPNRPISHSSTVSTSITSQSITSRSIKSPNSSLLTTTTNSCLQIKLDVLVLYSINDSKYIHENLGVQLENMYGKRFSFYFIHRDRMLGELDWLIENSCIIILVLRKPYNLIHDYMKVLSTYSTIKCFIILINQDHNHQLISIKAREKIARLYRTSDIYEWNSNINALIHEQLELFLEQNCGSATYVTD
ncbi:unnamed protein product [Adineta steineri]|uniref:LRRNT domain-containing protein n=1 Tax=Adineta steineri TaxID=433720 RepID=A0A815BRE4_9BILA|nr:unnamed protein product [Adineta steineri]